eukprot:TRINITY_DN14657_c0_g1_i1.p1 TRINITY_DN14657_c0_g1~~TRINITY_DN14657_c0_g1_i1.p1  ORF type:complete len:238 (+),score=34.60 TRINITY_DN14657_c0_g1_i1:77-790(+)
MAFRAALISKTRATRHISTSVPLLDAFRFRVSGGGTSPSTSSSSRQSFPAKKEWPKKAPQPEEQFVKGTHKLQIGKFAGKTFSEIYAEDPNYCLWVTTTVMTGEKVPDSMKVFAAYIQYRWMAAITHIMKNATPGCLSGQLLVVSGEPETMPRSALEGLIRLLHGEVVYSTRLNPSGKKPVATGVVLAGSKLHDGRPVADSPKAKKAAQAGIPISTFEDLLKQAGITEVPPDFNPYR